MLNYFLIDKCSLRWQSNFFFWYLATRYFCFVRFSLSHLLFYLGINNRLVYRSKFFNILFSSYIWGWLFVSISLNIIRIINLSVCSCRISIWITWRDVIFYSFFFSIYFCFVQLKIILNLTNWYMLCSYF